MNDRGKGRETLGLLTADFVLLNGTGPGIPPVCVMAERQPCKGLSFRPLMRRHVPGAAEHEPAAPPLSPPHPPRKSSPNIEQFDISVLNVIIVIGASSSQNSIPAQEKKETLAGDVQLALTWIR